MTCPHFFPIHIFLLLIFFPIKLLLQALFRLLCSGELFLTKSKCSNPPPKSESYKCRELWDNFYKYYEYHMKTYQEKWSLLSLSCYTNLHLSHITTFLDVIYGLTPEVPPTLHFPSLFWLAIFPQLFTCQPLQEMASDFDSLASFSTLPSFTFLNTMSSLKTPIFLFLALSSSLTYQTYSWISLVLYHMYLDDKMSWELILFLLASPELSPITANDTLIHSTIRPNHRSLSYLLSFYAPHSVSWQVLVVLSPEHCWPSVFGGFTFAVNHCGSQILWIKLSVLNIHIFSYYLNKTI